jgi:hypothetical protein
MQKDINPIWLKAAVAGGLWASFEIIIGSLLHNLHLPFSGTTLAACSVVLMISFLQIWKVKGLVWRAGIICGLMKSLSPSAVILGPMTGIMLEALIMELFIRLIGNNIAGYLFAGAGALLSAILHKVTSLLILYGSDVVKIYINLFGFLKKQINLPGIDPFDLIFGIILIYIFAGSVAALTGYFFGRYSVKMQQAEPSLPLSDDPFSTTWTRTDPVRPFKLSLLIIHLTCIPGMLILINHFGLKPVSLIPAILYIVFSIIYYKRILGRLKKPLFWSQLIIITLIAGFFWNPSGITKGNPVDGFMAGLEMSLRAVLVISAFSGLSVEIRNPRIRKVLFPDGPGNAYAAISLAFNSLPAMLDRSAKFKTFFRKPFHSLSNLLYDAELWLKYFQSHLGN